MTRNSPSWQYYVWQVIATMTLAYSVMRAWAMFTVGNTADGWMSVAAAVVALGALILATKLDRDYRKFIAHLDEVDALATSLREQLNNKHPE